uniref:Leucine rich repeat containing 75A n=1 Tax=Denticeps clupeoides TaxID=299321 RepID=A0AAY4DV27_9TELE
MGTKQTKGAGPDGGSNPWQGAWRRAQCALPLRAPAGAPRGSCGTPAPYQRRVEMVQEVLLMARQGRQADASELLKVLRQDLGMESTSLDDVLYRYASFRNLVDPITHDLILGLARCIHCPKTEGDVLSATEKVCRQLTYHLSPHSRWRKPGHHKGHLQVRCVSPVRLKVVVSSPPAGGTVDISGIPLSPQDVVQLASYLSQHSGEVSSVELAFTELTDEALLALLDTLSALPHLESLSLNGNRLTCHVLRHLTDALKDPATFPTLAWVDLGNNVDIFSLPQPFLLGLRKRCPKQGNLPTIQEQGEGPCSSGHRTEGRSGDLLELHNPGKIW